MKASQKLKAIDELMASDGWKVLSEVMQQEIMGAAMGLANSAQMPQDEMHFRRGSIWAGKQFLEMPANLRSRLESDAMIERSGHGQDDLTKRP